MRDARVGDFVHHHGTWDMLKLRYWLPTWICNHIRALIPPSESSFDDVMLWKGGSDGSFSVSAAIGMLCLQPVTRILYLCLF